MDRSRGGDVRNARLRTCLLIVVGVDVGIWRRAFEIAVGLEVLSLWIVGG